MFIFQAASKSHFFLIFHLSFGHFLKWRLFIWIGGDLPSPLWVFFQSIPFFMFPTSQISQVPNHLRGPETRCFFPEALFDLNRDNPTDIPDVVRTPERRGGML